jgi:sugar lactone lactonase YvrE
MRARTIGRLFGACSLAFAVTACPNTPTPATLPTTVKKASPKVTVTLKPSPLPSGTDTSSSDPNSPVPSSTSSNGATPSTSVSAPASTPASTPATTPASTAATKSPSSVPTTSPDHSATASATVAPSFAPGGPQVTTFAGDGTASLLDGPLAISEYGFPGALALKSDGSTLYVADTGNNCIRKITLAGSGTVVTIGGDAGGQASGYKDDPAVAKSRFTDPLGLAVDSTSGDVYVADTGNNCIRLISGSTGAITTVAGTVLPNYKDGVGVAASFKSPSGLMLDGTTLYVADTGNNVIRAIDLTSNTVTTLAGTAATSVAGSSPPPTNAGIHNDPNGAKAQFNGPFALAMDAAKKLYVLDTLNHRVRVVDTKAATKTVTTLVGPDESVTPPASGDSIGSGTPSNGRLNLKPNGGLAFGADGTLYIVDSGNDRIRSITAAGVMANYAGDGKVDATTRFGGFVDNCPLLAAEFDRATGVAVASDGTVYVSDSGNNRIRRIK